MRQAANSAPKREPSARQTAVGPLDLRIRSSSILSCAPWFSKRHTNRSCQASCPSQNPALARSFSK